MSRRALSISKLRLASLGVAGTLLASVVFPGALAYAASSVAATNTNSEVPVGDITSALQHSNGMLADSGHTSTTSDSRA
jgi:hypothetical protein